MKTVVNFYENYDEEARLTTNNARKIEFITTTSALNNHIEEHHKILELGAGTGVYSFYYAEKGNAVVATDITPKHIEIIRQKLEDKDDRINLRTEVVNAIDLGQYETEYFDVVLCMGPMYHITDYNDRNKCIEEALRVLKKDGLLAIAYINKHFVLNSVMTRYKKYRTHNFIDKIMDTGVTREGEEECFWTDAYFTSPSDMESFIGKFDVEIVDHIGTDGISPYLGNTIDEMDEEEYNAWIYYILKSCREKSILGISNHGLLLCKKK